MIHSDAPDEGERIREIFDAVLALPPEHRSEFFAVHLDPASQSDLAIRKEVERLLVHYDSTGVLDEKLFEPGPEANVAPLETGEILSGRFLICQTIGSGGMGKVYEAEDLTLRQQVALKTIRPEMAGNLEHAGRFRRELLISRNLSHRNLCKVFEYAECDRGPKGRVRFFTMELLRGETLAQRLARQGRMTGEEALAILEQVAAGLEEVHRNGIIHRDLKPSNIFLVPETLVPEAQGHGRAVVMDFGLARGLDSDDVEKTSTGVVMGTRFYMAPEGSCRADVRSDVFSFGVLALEMVTGFPSPLVPPRSVAPALSASWDKALVACFNHDPAKRPASPSEVVAMLRPRKRSWIRPAAMALAVVTFAVVGLAAWSVLGGPHSVQLSTKPLTTGDGLTIDPATSADGKLMVYASDRNSKNGDLNIWLQNRETQENTRITFDSGDEDEPDISANSKMIVWRARLDDTLFVKPTAGGSPRMLTKHAYAPRFSPDGRFIAYWTGIEGESTVPAGIRVIRVEGGESCDAAPGFVDARLPVWSRDGKSIFFRGALSGTDWAGAGQDIWTASFKWTGKKCELGDFQATGVGTRIRSAGLILHESQMLWDGSRLIFAAKPRVGFGVNLWSIRYFPRLRFLKTKLPGPEVFVSSPNGFRDGPAALGDGRFAFADWIEHIPIYGLDLTSGKAERVTNQNAMDTRVSCSADGNMLAFGRKVGEAREVWVRDRTRTIVADDEEGERNLDSNQLAVPLVSADGRTVAVSANRSIKLIDIATKKQTTHCRDCGELRSWAPERLAVLYLDDYTNADPSIKILDLSNDSTTTLISAPGVNEAAMSPDGKAVAFTIRKKNVHSTIYVTRIADTGIAASWVRITPTDGRADKLAWSPDSKFLYFTSTADGFVCLWKRAVDTVHLRMPGEVESVAHFHRAAESLDGLNPASASIALGGGELYFSMDKTDSNIHVLLP